MKKLSIIIIFLIFLVSVSCYENTIVNESNNNIELLFNQLIYGGSYDDKVNDIQIDISSNIYVGGSTESIKSQYDALIMKFDKNGVEDTTNWNKMIDGGSSDSIQSIAIDYDNNVYIAINSSNIISDDSKSDWWIKKFDEDGVEDTTNWNKMIDYDNKLDHIESLIIDKNNDVYVIGTIIIKESSDLNYKWWIKKFDENGVEDTTNWNKMIVNDKLNMITSIAIDNNNNVYIGGNPDNLVGENSYFDWWIKKFDENGVEDTLNWNKMIDNNNRFELLTSIAIDSENNVYIGGSSLALVNENSGFDWWIKKFDENGVEDTTNWNKMIDGYVDNIDVENSSFDYLSSIIIDSNNNVYVGGYKSNFNDNDISDIWIKKFDENGVEDTTNWNKMIKTNKINFGRNITDDLVLEIDYYNNLYIATSDKNLVSEDSGSDWLIMAFTPDGLTERFFRYWGCMKIGTKSGDVIFS